MSQDKDPYDKFSELRSRAEELLDLKASDRDDFAQLSPGQVQRLVHELRVHQIELEMQNEDLRQHQIELELLKDNYLDLYDFAPVGYLTLNEKGQILEANLTAVRLLGDEKQRLTKRFFSRFIPQEFADVFYLHLQQLSETQFKQTSEIRLVREDGTQFYAQLESVAVQDESGKGNRFRMVLSDITERKKIEESLRESEEKYRLIFSMERDAITLIDGVTNQFIEVNDAAAQLWGYTKEELVGMNALDVSAEPDLSRRALVEASRKGGVHVPLRWHRKKDGAIFPVEMSACPVTWKGKALICGIIRGISERMKLEELALQSARLKSIADLSSGVAHHFNNLLQVVMAGASLALDDLQSGELSETGKYLKKMLNAAERGARMVERLQAFANTRGGITERDFASFDLSDVARNAAEVSKPLWMAECERRGINIDLQMVLEDGCWMRGQENEILEVIGNLLKNAGEALPDGGIIEVKTLKEDNEAVISVSDTGTGIAVQDIPHVFQPFWTTKGFDIGRGMGLAVAHGLVSRHGGTISVHSQVDAGSTFTVRFPLSDEPLKKAEQSDQATVVSHLAILVIDDESFVAELIETICIRAGHQVFVALSGSEALRIFEKEKVDLVICDLGMPGMSGWDVGKAIRTICEEKGIAKPYFILLTAWSGQELNNDQIAESGTDTVASKPISSASLLNTVREVAAKPTMASP